jgi:hypothetical protein
MGKPAPYDFKDYQPDFERVVEIYNAWGSSECTEKEGNLRPIQCNGKKAEVSDGSIQAALLQNCRFGFVAGGYDDRGFYEEFQETDQMQYTPGLTGIVSKDHSRSALWDALYNRSCYATTGARMIIGMNIAGKTMGGELTSISKPGLEFNRHVTGYVIGTKPIQKVEILRNAQVIHTYTPDDYKFDFAYDDMEKLSNIVIESKDERPPFIFYYLRVIQEDGHVAWGSPIWVDFEKGPLPPPPKKTKKKS